MKRLRAIATALLLVGLVGASTLAGVPPARVAHAAGTGQNGFAASDFATNFPSNYVCPALCGPIGLAFDSSDNLYVTDYYDGNLYRFASAGGTASSNLVGPIVPPGGTASEAASAGPNGMAFGKDGELYVARYNAGEVVQINPSTGAISRTVASLPCRPAGLATDPLSGDLFVSFPGCSGDIDRISNPSSSTPTVSTYVSPGGTDGLSFAPDGTLYSETNGCVYKTSGTNITPTSVTQIACPTNTSGWDGIAFSSNGSGSPTLYVNGNDGNIVQIDPTTGAQTIIVSGGTRGDFVTVGPDSCLYATQSSNIEKVTSADGTCPFTPVGVIPQLRLVPDSQIGPTGSSQTVTATLSNVATPASQTVTFTVSGPSAQTGTASTNASGVATFSYAGTNAGNDSVVAQATVNGTNLTSNQVTVTWTSNPLTANAGGQGGQYTGTEGAAIALSGSASGGSGSYTYSWSYSVAKAPAGASCSFSPTATAQNPSLTCNEEGSYTVQVAVSDGVNPAVTSQATVTVADAGLATTAKCAATSSQAFNGTTATVTDAASPSGTASDFSATINWGDGSSSAGTVSGPNGGPYTVSGSHAYASTGNVTISTTITDVGGSTASTSSTPCTPLVYAPLANGGSFALGDKTAAGALGTSTTVTWWGAQWSKLNVLSGGTAPSQFKGFAANLYNASGQATKQLTCGDSYTYYTGPGNSSGPPSAVPAYMATAASSKITTTALSTSNIRLNGNIVHVYVVKTSSGYQPDPSYPGTGTVVAQLC